LLIIQDDLKAVREFQVKEFKIKTSEQFAATEVKGSEECLERCNAPEELFLLTQQKKGMASLQTLQRSFFQQQERSPVPLQIVEHSVL